MSAQPEEKHAHDSNGNKQMPTMFQQAKVSPYWTHFLERSKDERGDNILHHLSSLNAEAVTKWMVKL